MRKSLLTASLGLAFTLPVPAEDPPPTAPPAEPAAASENAEEKLTLGEVTASNVNVRAGNSTNHRIVCVATKGDQVLIASESGDFFKILAPKSAQCWVACQYVKKEGESGTVTGHGINLRPTPDTSHAVIGQVEFGQTVRIVGQDSMGTWFRIEPPKGVYAFVAKKFVTVKGDYAEIRSEEAKKESERIAAEEGARTIASRWQEAEALVKAQVDVDPAERDYTEAIIAYEEIATASADARLAQRAKDKAEYLKGLQEVQQLVKSLDETGKVRQEEYEKKIAELEQKWQAEQAAKSEKREKKYIVQGWVEEVSTLFGRPGTHKIVEAGVVLYYLKSDTLDLRRYWHNRIRIVKGVVTEAPDGWEDGPKVIEVEEIEVLE
jgi:uncharacterized protein YgiM (DUF1202 family)